MGWIPGAYIAEDVAPWIDASGNLIAATGGAAVGTPPPGSPDTPSTPSGAAQAHRVQPKRAATGRGQARLSGWRERDDEKARREPTNPHHPTPASRASVVHEASRAHPTALLMGHSHAKAVPSRTEPKTTKTQLIQKLEKLLVGGIKIVNPRLAIEAATKANLPITLALALLSQESGGGKNEWGHDRGTIFSGGYDALHGRHWGETVTEASYDAYKAERGPTGRGGMQGVGPTQLTWYSTQEAADKHGGAWKPLPNMTEGFSVLRSNVQSQGLTYGIALYNGPVGAKTLTYAAEVLKKEKQWAAALGLPSVQGP